DLDPEGMEHPGDLIGFGSHGSDLVIAGVAEVACEEQMVVEFRQGAFRHVEEVGEVLGTPPLGALGDIGRYRGGCATALGCEAEALLLRKRGREAVDLKNQGMTTLPDFQLRVRLHELGLRKGVIAAAVPFRVDVAQGGQAVRNGLALNAPFEGAGLPPGRRRCAGAERPCGLLATIPPRTAMTTFESVHESRVAGKLVAIDRLIIKGHLNGWMPKGAFARFLLVQSVLLVAFKGYVTRVSGKLRAHAMALAAKAGRSYQYLEQAYTAGRGRSKEDLAREIAERDGIREGLIAVFAAVEPCMSFNVRGNRETHKLEVVRGARKCLHFYFYIMDREFGFMHVRLQSWFPFNIQVYVNGHEWLCRQLERRGVGF